MLADIILLHGWLDRSHFNICRTRLSFLHKVSLLLFDILLGCKGVLHAAQVSFLLSLSKCNLRQNVISKLIDLALWLPGDDRQSMVNLALLGAQQLSLSIPKRVHQWVVRRQFIRQISWQVASAALSLLFDDPLLCAHRPRTIQLRWLLLASELAGELALTTKGNRRSVSCVQSWFILLDAESWHLFLAHHRTYFFTKVLR